jgi:excisionase family DNA binding protein
MSARVPSSNESQGSAAGRLLTQLARLLPEALDDDALHELASRLIPHLEERQSAASQEDRLLTAAEAAERASVNVETVRRAIRAGDLRVAARIGRSARVSVVAIDDWLAKTVRTEDGTRPRRRRRSTRSGQPHELSLRAAFMTDD